MAISLQPNLIEAKLFAVECYIEKELPEQADRNLQQAKEIADTTEVEAVWHNPLQDMTKII